VVDTVGAGDAFGGAFLAWWTGHGLTRADLRQPAPVRSAILAALDAAAINCARRGADPPWAHELAGRPGWSWLRQMA
jgi:fructokinase